MTPRRRRCSRPSSSTPRSERLDRAARAGHRASRHGVGMGGRSTRRSTCSSTSRGRARAAARAVAIVEAQEHAEAAYDAAVIDGADFPRAIWSLARGIALVVRGRPRRSDTRRCGRRRPRSRTPSAGFVARRTPISRWPRRSRATSPRRRATNRPRTRLEPEPRRRVRGRRRTRRGVGARGAGRAVRRGPARRSRRGDRRRAPASHVRGVRAPRCRALCAFPRVADRLVELSRIVDGPLVDAMAKHARGLADDDGERLDEAARAFSAMTLDLFAAEAGFAAARVHRRDGRRARAFAALELARARTRAGARASAHPRWRGPINPRI